MADSELTSASPAVGAEQHSTGKEAFLQSQPSESDLRKVCSKVGGKWRAVATYLDIPASKVDYYFDGHKPDIEEVFFRILTHWRSGQGATWAVLLTALRTAKLNAQANELQEWGETRTPSSSTMPDTELQPPSPRKPAHNLTVASKELPPQAALLKQQAYGEYSRFKLGEGPKANVAYTKLAVLKRPPSSRRDDVKDKMVTIRRFKECGPRVGEENASHITPVDLLKKGSELVRVVYGQAGSGKTTLLKQMCKALSFEEADSDFELVLYFPLRDRAVSSAGDLQSLLKYYMQDEDEVGQLGKGLNRSNGRGLLLVLDGADEVKDLLEQSSRSLVQSLLQGRVLPEAHIIISSRPGACPSLQDHTATFYEVQGFDRDAITSYVKSFFQAKPSAADRMLSQLASRPDLLGGMYIPMNSFILCSIFEHDSSFPATMTACYQAFVRQTISRECRREKGKLLYLDPLLKYALLPEDIRFLLASLGALSFKGLRESPPVFIFDEPSIRSTFPKELLPLGAPIDEYLFKGLLHIHASRRGFESLHSFSFSHGTQQEFFAALHLSQLEKGEQAQFWRDNLFNASFSVVLRFFAGLTGLTNPQVAEQICCTPTGAAEDGSNSSLMGECSSDDPRLLFLFHALYESQNTGLTKRVMQSIPSLLKFRLSLSAFDTMAIAYCLRQCSHLRALNMSSLYCTLLSAQCLSHLKAVLQSNPQCQLDFGGRLRLSCDHFSADDAKTLSKVAVSLRKLYLKVLHTDCAALASVCSLPGVRELDVTVRSDVKDDSGWQQVETSFAENKDLDILYLDGCDAFMVNMLRALAMGRNTSIQTLFPYSEPLPDVGVGALVTCVAAMTQLCQLVIRHLPLPVLKALAERKEQLETLYVWSPPGVNWDDLSEDQWKEAEEAATSAKVREVYLEFDANSRQRSRAIQTISDGLSKNKFIRDIELSCVPDEMKQSVRQTLANSDVTLNIA